MWAEVEENRKQKRRRKEEKEGKAKDTRKERALHRRRRPQASALPLLPLPRVVFIFAGFSARNPVTDLRSKVAFISLFYLWRIRKLLAGHPPSLLSLLTALFPLFAASILFSGAILLYAATPCSPLRSRLLCRPPPRPLLRALHRCLSSARKKPSSAVDSVAAAAVGCPSSSSTSAAACLCLFCAFFVLVFP
ncbi:hypothetical protein AHAS_Ahas07G0170300 [Arachis hypogaea]